MSEDFNKIKLWYDFISKKNDRHLSEIRASGATSWVIAVAILYIAQDVIQKIPAINSGASKLEFIIIVFATLMNFAFFLIQFTCSIYQLSEYQHPSTRLGAKYDSQPKPIILIPKLIIFIILTALNYLSISIAKQKNIPHYPFILCLVFYFTLLIGYLIPQIIETIQKKRKHYISRVRYKNIFLQAPRFITTVEIIFTIISAIPIWYGVTRIKTDLHIELIMISAKITLITYLALYLSNKSMLSLSRKLLDTIETDILINDMGEKQIREMYVQEFLGPDINEWLKNNEAMINKLYEEIATELDKSTHKIEEIKTISNKYSHERKGRTETVLHNIKQQSQKYSDFTIKFSDDIKQILKGKMPEDAKKNLMELLDKLQYQAKDINKRTSEIKKSIKSYLMT